jgi:hypothetical protein
MNQLHEVQYVPRWQTITRRLLFVLYLVASGLIILGAGYNGWHETDFFWVGLGSPYILFALWLTTRASVSRTRLGMCRVLTYAFAFIFGRALYPIGHNYIHQLWAEPTSWARRPIFESPSTSAICTMLAALLLMPLVSLSSASILQKDEVTRASNRISVAWLLGITTLVAFYLAYCQFHSFICDEFGYRTERQITTVGFYQLGAVLGGFVLFYSLTKQWWFTAIAFVFAIAINVLVTKLVGYLISEPEAPGYAFKLYELLAATGQALLLLIALLTAKVLGIRYSIGARKEPAIADATINP